MQVRGGLDRINFAPRILKGVVSTPRHDIRQEDGLGRINFAVRMLKEVASKPWHYILQIDGLDGINFASIMLKGVASSPWHYSVGSQEYSRAKVGPCIQLWIKQY